MLAFLFSSTCAPETPPKSVKNLEAHLSFLYIKIYPKYFIFFGNRGCTLSHTPQTLVLTPSVSLGWTDSVAQIFQLAKVCNAQSCALCPLLWLQQSFPAILACKGSLSLIVQVVTGFLKADCNRLHYGYVAGLSNPEFCTRDRNQSVIRAKSDICFAFVIWKCVFICFVINVIIFDANLLVSDSSIICRGLFYLKIITYLQKSWLDIVEMLFHLLMCMCISVCVCVYIYMLKWFTNLSIQFENKI